MPDIEVVSHGGTGTKGDTGATGPAGPAGPSQDAYVIVAGNLGSTYTLALASHPLVTMSGTLNANCAVTTSGLIAGCVCYMELAQDVTGGRTLTLNGTVIPVPSTASVKFLVTFQSLDGSSLNVQSGVAVSPAIVGIVTQSATPAINTDIMNVAGITGLAQAITSMTTNLTGTPTDGQTLLVRLTDSGTGRAITWGASFEASGGVALPTTTVSGQLLAVAFIWNTATTKWRVVGVA